MYLLLVLCFLPAIKSASFPSSIKLCSKKDPDFSGCASANMMDALQILKNGDKNLGIPILDPFFVPKMDIAGNEGAAVNLDQKYNDVNFYGMTVGTARDFKIDFDKCHWEFKVVSPKIEMISKYVMKGKLLVFPINGHGNSNVTITNLDVAYQMDCDYQTKEGKRYVQLKNIKMKMSDPEHVSFNFENIIPGNPTVSESVAATINENSDTIFRDVKGAFEQVFQQIYTQIMNSIFSKIPIDEVFLD